MSSEIDIQNSIRKALSKHGIVLRLNNGLFYTEDGRPVKSGLPKGTSDLLYIGNNGLVAFMEVKTATGRPSKEQINFINAMQARHLKAGIVRSVEDALNLIGEVV